MKIPLVDLKAQYQSIQAEIDQAMSRVVQETAFIGGRYVEEFEKAFAAFSQTKYAVGASSGTDALRLALVACGVGPGDEVITVPNTFIATTEAVFMVGASPRFVDAHPETLTMDPRKLEAAITPKTKAVIPVHLYGRPCDMDPILDIAKRRGLRVIGDAAQAHGAMYKGKPIGRLGDVACFSFFPGKNLGAYGDAGGMTTNDPALAENMALMRDHGRKSKYEHMVSGFNCRLDALQASILSAKLRHLESWTKKRIELGGALSEMLAGIPGVELPPEDGNGSRSVMHLYVIHLEQRDSMKKKIEEKGVAAGIHYPIPLHMQPAHAALGYKKGDFPVAERSASRALSLPLYPELTQAQLRYIADAVREAAAVSSTKSA